MQCNILCPQWGHEHLPPEAFLEKVKEAGYDGVDTWVPEKKEDRVRFCRLLGEYDLAIVTHQHQATGSDIKSYCRSLEYYLRLSLEPGPLLINSHSGRDYFCHDDQLRVIDTVAKFSADNQVVVAHETHRGRIGFGPGNAAALFAERPEMKITADFSHWVCVTESFLENFSEVVETAVGRTAHTHARVGFPEGPQVPDPSAPAWSRHLDFFMGIWKRIYDRQKADGAAVFTITPEFGPPPYMWINPDGSPVASQWQTNLFMKDLLRLTFGEGQ